MSIKRTLAAAKQLGVHGDTDIVHVNRAEENLLKSMGGSGSINPRTGLQQYFTERSHADSGGGHAGGFHDGGGRGNGGGGYADIGFGRGNYSSGGATIGRNRPGYSGGPGIGRSNNERYARASGYGVSSPENPEGVTARHGSFGTGASTASTSPNQADLNSAKAFRDYQGNGDTILDRIGNFLAGNFGLQENSPYGDPSNPFGANNVNAQQTGNANWSIDPITGALALGGMVLGIPGGATAYQGLKALTGLQGPQISLGSDVFGGPTNSPTSNPSASTANGAQNLAGRSNASRSYLSGHAVYDSSPTGTGVGDQSPSTDIQGASGAESNPTDPQPIMASFDPNYDFTGNSAAAAGRSPFNNRIGGFGAGGFSFGGKPRKTKPLSDGPFSRYAF